MVILYSCILLGLRGTIFINFYIKYFNENNNKHVYL